MRHLICLALVCTFGFQLRAEATRPDPAAFVEQVTSNFKTWDQDHNGRLSVAELATAANDRKTTGGSAAAVAALLRSQNNPKVTAPELTLDNILTLSKVPSVPGAPNMPKMYFEGISKISRASHVVFASELPNIETLHQGKLGDCFCLAPLGAMLHRDPKQVAAMFQVQPDGTCNVMLGKKTISVEMPTDTELALSASARNDGLWVNLYEKAFGILRNDAKPEKDRSALPLDAVAKGGSAGTVLAQITGHEITRFNCKSFKDDKLSPEEKAAKLQALRKQLIDAVREKRLITCGTTTPTTPGITPNHAYAVFDFDEKTDTLQLWNPHGTNFTPKDPPSLTAGYPRKAGVFSIPLADFVQQFAGVAFEQMGKVEK